MPIVNYRRQPMFDVPEDPPAVPGEDDIKLGSDAPARPSWGAAFGAAMRHDNEIGSFLSSELRGVDNNPEEGYVSAWDSIKGTKYEPYWESFVDVRNPRRAEAVKRQIDQELEDKKILHNAPWWQALAVGAPAAVLSPTILLPGGAFVRGARGGISALRTGASVGTAAGIGTTAQEALLQTDQETRELSESAQNVGASVLVGGLLSAGGAKLLDALEWRRMVDAVDRQLADTAPREAVPDAATPTSAGAAAVEPRSIDDMSVAGRAAGAVASATKFINPGQRLGHSPLPETRSVAQELHEVSQYMRHNDEGVASPRAVETLRKEWNAGLAKAVESTRAAYKEYRKSGGPLSRLEFQEAVGRAMRRGDEDANPHVAAIAKEWRKSVFDPLKDAAIKAGLLDEDVSVTEAVSYFSRMWNRGRLVAEETEAKRVFADYFKGKIDKEYDNSVKSFRALMAKRDQEIADLNLSPEARVKTLGELDLSLKGMDALGGRQLEMADRLSELASEMREARKGGGNAGEARYAELKAEADAIKKEGGDALKTYMGARSELRSRRRNVDLGSAGLADRSDRILDTLADIEEASQRAMERLIEKGQKLERDLDKLDADALEARITQLADQYAAIAKRAEASAERAQTQVKNINKRAAAAETKNIERGAEIAEESDVKIAAVLAKEAEKQGGIAQRMAQVAERLRLASEFSRDGGHDALMVEIKNAIDKATRETSAQTMARGERAARLGERLKNVDPRQIEARIKAIAEMKRDAERAFYDRWEVRNLGEGVDAQSSVKPDFTRAASDIADEMHAILTGRAGDSVRPEFLKIGVRGPMKDRTFHIPDELVERWLESDVDTVGRRYTHVMGADVDLANKFGSVDMKDQIQSIKDGYARLRDGVTDPKELAKLDAAMRADLHDIEGVRDVIRGTYHRNAHEGNWGRIHRAAQDFQYITRMGQIVLSSLTEPARVVMAKGLMPTMRAGFAALKDLDGIKWSVKEAKLAGNVNDRALSHRLSTVADLNNYYTKQGPVEKFLDSSTNIASKLNGIRIWTDYVKSVSSVMIQNHILDAATNFSKASAKDKRYLAFLGIDEDMAGRISEQFAKHGETIEGTRVANTEKWTEGLKGAEYDRARAEVRAYRAALNKDLDSMVVTRGAADVPLFANTPLGRTILQFNTFNLASHQRILLRGLQEGHARLLGTVVALSSIGMLQTYLSAVIGNRTDKLPSMTENPGWWISEGIDKSGIFSIFFQAANAFEILTAPVAKSLGLEKGFNPIKALMQAFDQGSQQSERVRTRNPSSLAGPTAGTLGNIFTASAVPGKVLRGEPLTKSEKYAAEQLVPFSSYYGMRQLLRFFVNPPED